MPIRTDLFVVARLGSLKYLTLVCGPMCLDSVFSGSCGRRRRIRTYLAGVGGDGREQPGGVRHLCFCGDRAKNLSKFLGVINGMEGSEHSRDAQDGLCV